MATKKKASKKAAKPGKTKVVRVKPEDLAAWLNVKLTKPLDGKKVNQLRKALPGYAEQLDNVANSIREAPIGLKDVTPQGLLDMQTERASLLAAEQVLHRVWQSVYHQRLQLDDLAMGALQKVARRVEALSEDEQELLDAYAGLLKFFASYRKGPGPKADVATPDDVTLES